MNCSKYISISIVFAITSATAQIIHPAGGGEAPLQSLDEISEAQRTFIQEQIENNISLLRQEGKITDTENQKSGSVTYEFPLAWNDGFTGYNFYCIYNFVDQDPLAPGYLLDYNCGARTYDTDGGYNHMGIDYVLWPFDWNMMEDGAVKIIAAAPGMVIYKSDGNPDHNCTFNNFNWNAVYIRHADESVAWYGHMKNGSTTTKEVGEMVEAGEYLGLVGSSGSSTAPHLHFENYDSEGVLIDPFAGICNNMNEESWWTDQEPYYNPMINKIQTHSAPPVFNPCPDLVDINEENYFEPGELAYFAFYARDLQDFDQCHLKITMADNTVWYEWDFYQPVYYTASYWYWWYTLPEDAPEGIWKWSCEVAGTYYEHEFVVGELPSAISNESLLTNFSADYQDDVLSIHLTSAAHFNSDLIVSSMNGQTIFRGAYEIENGAQSFSIKLPAISPGIYTITMSETASGNFISERFFVE